ncbi:intercompartmental signaling factor BofC [Bacillus sp. REN3]|uniref:intercompartmental signaling factor BofC n=1 Tax=Bacillus sp. REN3 TaxID=2802440 RepID=UPI001FEF2960|nr:intercompartmental signaling factor BofC [Bacillus sp. REN3]
MGSMQRSFSISMAALLLISVFSFWLARNTEPAFAEKPEGNVQEINEPLEITITLQRAYLDGEMSEEKVKEKIWSMEDFWAKYDDWQLVDLDNGKAVFRMEIDDISPLLKGNGYFGLSQEGVLTIFNGRPDRSNIIQSFFQIDLGRLESIKRDQLEKGIKIKDKKRYEQVLETFKPYTLQEQ